MDERNRNRWFARRCFCGENAVLRTSRSRANPGRRFFGCRKYGGDEVDYGYFLWFDPPLGDGNRRNRVDEEMEHRGKSFWKKMILCFMIGLFCGLFLRLG